MNWIDLVIIAIFILYVLSDYKRGFLSLVIELAGIVLAIFLTLKTFAFFEPFFAKIFPQLANFSLYFSFTTTWLITAIIFLLITRLIAKAIPNWLNKNALNVFLGLIPAAIKAIIFLMIVVSLLTVMPFNSSFHDKIKNSYFGRILVYFVFNSELRIQNILSTNGVFDSLSNTFIGNGGHTLNFSTNKFFVDERGEKNLLFLTNQARQREGLAPLVLDNKLQEVARNYARKMLTEGFFSHDDPLGGTTFGRLTQSGVTFVSAAENLALAPTVDLAQIGLMNSLKHRKNILDSKFSRIGIGVIDAGKYGLMIVEEFAN